MFVKAKGEIKLTFSSTLGAGGTSNGVERSSKVESEETANGATVPTTSHSNLDDPDDIVSEFLGQINHAAVAADGPSLVADVPDFDRGQCQQQRRPLSDVHDGTNAMSERYVNGARQPASLTHEPDPKLHSYGGGGGVDGELLPVGMSGSGDTGSGPAAETLKKMAALHRRLEEKTGSGSQSQFLATSDYDRSYGGGRHSLHADPYQLPVSYCTGNSRCGSTYGGGASKPLSHYPATVPASTLAATFPQYGYPTQEPDAAGSTGSSVYMTQSQCVDFRLSHLGVQARAMMSQSAAVRAASPYRTQTPSSAAAWNRFQYAYPQPRYPSADDRRGWISSPYGRPEACNKSVPITGNGSEHQSRVFHEYRGSQDHAFGGEGRLQPPPPPYSDYVRQKQRLQFDRKWNQPTVEARWRRRPWTRHHDFVRTDNPGVTVTPAPTPASGHVTSADVEFPVGDEPLSQEFFFDTYSSSNVKIDNTDFSFIDDIFNAQ